MSLSFCRTCWSLGPLLCFFGGFRFRWLWFWWPGRQFRVELSGAASSECLVQKCLKRCLLSSCKGAMRGVFAAGLEAGAAEMVREAQ